jgi:hypothetical protein
LATGFNAALTPLKLVVVHLGHDLHQSLRADRAFRERIEAGFDGHYRQHQQRVDLHFPRRVVGRADQHVGGVAGDPVTLGQPVRHPFLLALRRVFLVCDG